MKNQGIKEQRDEGNHIPSFPKTHQGTLYFPFLLTEVTLSPKDIVTVPIN